MATTRFMQNAGAASQSWRFEDDRFVVAEADARAAGEYELAYLDVNLSSLRLEPQSRGLTALWPRARSLYARAPLFEPRRGRTEVAVWAGAHALAIVAELGERWRAARRRAVEVDFAADPGSEMRRFNGLMVRGIVSAEEAAAALARIAARACADQ